MEWDFTSSQIMKGEVVYTQEDFLNDLRVEIAENFSNYEDQKRERVLNIFYTVIYMHCIEYDVDAIEKKTQVGKDLITLILTETKANCSMLRAIIMADFLKNLKSSGGSLSDRHNLELINASLYKFHHEHNL